MFHKLSLAIVLLVIAEFVNGQVTLPGKCPKVKLMKDFDLAAYTGVWHQYGKYPFFWELGYRCSFAQYGDLGNNTVSVHNGAISVTSGTPYVTDGYAKVLNPGVLAVVFFDGDSETEPNYTVLNTDYESYTVVHSCKKLPVGHAEFLWILTRAAIPSEKTIAAAIKVLEDNKISKDYIIKQDQQGCPPVRG